MIESWDERTIRLKSLRAFKQMLIDSAKGRVAALLKIKIEDSDIEFGYEVETDQGESEWFYP